MFRFKGLLVIGALFLGACHDPERETPSHLSTIYGVVEASFASQPFPGVGVLWLVRDGQLLYPFCSAIAVSTSRLMTARHCMKSVGPGIEIWYDTRRLAAPDLLLDYPENS